MIRPDLSSAAWRSAPRPPCAGWPKGAPAGPCRRRTCIRRARMRSLRWRYRPDHDAAPGHRPRRSSPPRWVKPDETRGGGPICARRLGHFRQDCRDAAGLIDSGGTIRPTSRRWPQPPRPDPDPQLPVRGAGAPFSRPSRPLRPCYPTTSPTSSISPFLGRCGGYVLGEHEGRLEPNTGAPGRSGRRDSSGDPPPSPCRASTSGE